MKKICLILILVLSSVCCFAQGRNISATTKKIVFSRDGGVCQCCGSSQRLEYDHIQPYSCGGTNTASNIQLLCLKCNRSKSNSCYCKVHNKKVGINCCSGNTSKKSRSQSEVASRQCSGTTKKGKRCQKPTKNPTGRCHFHD